MTRPVEIKVIGTNTEGLAALEGRVAVVVGTDGKMDQVAKALNRATKGALARFLASEAFGKMKAGQVQALSWPAGLAADSLDVVKLDCRPTPEEARNAGAALAKAKGRSALLLATGAMARADELAAALAL